MMKTTAVGYVSFHNPAIYHFMIAASVNPIPLLIREKIMRIALILCILTSFTIGACSPTVKVEAPDKPITINLNVKIQHEIRVKVEKELDNVLSEDSGLF